LEQAGRQLFGPGCQLPPAGMRLTNRLAGRRRARLRPVELAAPELMGAWVPKKSAVLPQ
jgi:hypothetical protein